MILRVDPLPSFQNSPVATLRRPRLVEPVIGQTQPPQGSERLCGRFTVDLLSSDSLATILKLTGQSAPVLVLQQAEAEEEGGWSRPPAEKDHPEGQANGQDLLASVLAAAAAEIQLLIAQLHFTVDHS